MVRVSVGFLQKICLGKFSSFQEWVQYRLNRWHVSVCVLNCVLVLFSSFVFALILEMSEYGGLFCHNGWKNDFKEISSKKHTTTTQEKVEVFKFCQFLVDAYL